MIKIFFKDAAEQLRPMDRLKLITQQAFRSLLANRASISSLLPLQRSLANSRFQDQLAAYLGVPERIRSRPLTADTYPLPQSQNGNISRGL